MTVKKKLFIGLILLATLPMLVSISIAKAIVMVVIAVLFGWLLTLRLIQPVERLASEIDYIETNSDLSFRLTGKPSDIIVQIVGSLNRLLLKIHTIVGKVAARSGTLSEAAANIDLLCLQTYQGIEKQGMEINGIAAEITTMMEARRQMANNVNAGNKINQLTTEPKTAVAQFKLSA